jgi:putative transposase
LRIISYFIQGINFEKELIVPRRARLAVAGIPWHIIQRGNNKAACFFSEKDYLYFLEHLQYQSERFECAIHSYCLMTNHVHLLITPQRADGPSLMMKHLGQRFVQYINRTYERSGTLWEGRFKSCLAQDESYALSCYRYIELNPVRAKMVAHPRDYRWSSFHHNGDGRNSQLISPHSSYLGLESNEALRLKNYREFVELPIAEPELAHIRSATNGNYVYGNSEFQSKIEQALNQRVSPGRAGRPHIQI